MRVPSSTPAGILTVRLRRRSERPSPWQASHGSATISPDAAAGRTAALDDEEALLGADLAGAAAGRAGARAIGGRLAAAPVALLASGERLDGERRFPARERVLEAQLQIVAKVGAARGVGAAAAPRVHELAEDRREDVGEALEAAGAERVLAAAAVLERGLAEAVVGGALLRVAKHVIGLADRLELGFLLGAAVVAVGMAFLRQPPIGALDRLWVRAAVDAQEVVIVLLDHDSAPLSAFGLTSRSPALLSPAEEEPVPSLSSSRPEPA